MSSLWPRVRVFQWPDLAALGVTDWRACSGVHQRAYPSLSVKVPLTELEAEGFRASTSRGGSAADLLRCRKALFARHLTDRGIPAHRWTFHPVGREWAHDPFEWYPWPVADVVAHTSEPPTPSTYRPGFQDTCGWAYPCWAWAVKQTLGEATLKLDVARILRHKSPAFLDGIAAVFGLGGIDALLEYLNSLPCIQKLAKDAAR